MDYKCNLNCPAGKPSNGPPICCATCKLIRKKFVTDENKHLWSDEYGFWSPDGCRLSRENMPEQCKAYDCRNFRWAFVVTWTDGKWAITNVGQLAPNQILITANA